MAFLIAAIVVLVGAATYAIMRKRPAVGVAIDPFVLSEPWRRHVSAAQAAKRQYAETVSATQAGPLHDRLVTIGTQIDKCVEECWLIAKRGDDLDAALERLHLPRLRNDLEMAIDEVRQASLQSQIDAAERIAAARQSTDERLRVLTTRMGELVAQGTEVSVGTDSTDQLGSAVGDVATQLESLRLAVDELNGRQSPSS